ncbi:Glycosyltransferase family 61 protein [Dorcoceras hygrometricum]|nr:Glycosyltransferase family 61 protein [Dorcoceras hygrometricum]
MEKFKKTQIAELLIVSALLVIITPLSSTASLRFANLYFVINFIIIAVAADAGVFSLFLVSEPGAVHSGVVSQSRNPTIISQEKMDGTDCNGPPQSQHVENRSSDEIFKEVHDAPSIFFIGESDSTDSKYVEDEEFGEGITGKELFQKAEIFIGNFYKQLNIQREESWKKLHDCSPWFQYFSASETSFSTGSVINKAPGELELMKFHLSRLVRSGEDRRNLEYNGFACDESVRSMVCVSNQPVKIDTRNMTAYIASNQTTERETIIRPYAKQEDEVLKFISPVHIFRNGNLTKSPPFCEFRHEIPAVVFSSGSSGNVFHEISEIIIPLFITTRQFESRVFFILEDYKPSFMAKYGKILSHLSAFEVINPASNGSVHCFPGSVIGLKYNDNLAINSSEVPGGYSMSDFRLLLRQSYGLRFRHVSLVVKPRLMLLSRTGTRRFLNEDEMILMIKELGFELIVVKRSSLASNLNKFTQMINSCSVLVGAHGAGLTNELFLPSGAVMVQVELLGTEWASNTYYGDTARAMGVHYLRYKIEPEESSLVKLYGRNHPIITDPAYMYNTGGYRAARTVYLDLQNVRINLPRFRETLVEALSIVTDLERLTN